MLFAVLMVGNALAVEKQSRAKPINPGDNRLRHSMHVMPYVPKDIKGIVGEGERCNEHGNVISTGDGRCMQYHSKSEGTDWIIRYAGSGSAKQIFKLVDRKSVLWATFTGKDESAVTYASAEAQKFAGKQSDDNTNVANGDKSSPAGDVLKDAQNGDTGELIKKGIGIMKGFKF